MDAAALEAAIIARLADVGQAGVAALFAQYVALRDAQVAALTPPPA